MHLKSLLKTNALVIITVLLLSFKAFSQAPNLLNYQGVARNSVGNPLPNQTMKLRLSIHNLLPSGAVVYSEIRQITTNLGGLFSVQIGSSGASSSIGTIAGVNWIVGDKFLQVELDPASNNNYIDIGTVQLVSVPYAFAAGSAAAVKTNANLTGVVTSIGNATSIANGAITSDMIGTLNKSKVGLDLVNNTSDASKPISDLTQAALDLKLNTTGNAATATKLATARNINGVAFDGSGDITVTADARTLSGNTLNATVTGSSLTSVGTITSGTWNGTTIAIANGGTGATTAAGALTNLGAEAITNKSTNITTDASSTTKYPSIKLIKDYVDAQTAAAGVADGSITSAKIKDGDIVNADVSNTAAIDYSKLNLTGSIINGDLAGSITASKLVGTDIATIGTITAGTWNGTTIAIANGGTGATTAAGALTNLGAEAITNKSTNITTDASSTTKYPSIKLIKDYVDAQTAAAGVADGSITSVKIKDGDIVNADVSNTAAIDYSKLNLTGSIINGDLAGSITASKLVGTDISTVGTITAGTWSGTTIAIANGGTGATTAAGALTNLGAEAITNKSIDITTDATSTTKYPSIKLIKDYVDAQTAAAGVADGSITSVKIKDGDIVNADVSNTAAIDYSKLNLTGSIINGDLAGSITASKLVGTDISTVGTITAGTWSGTTIAIAKGGTGATTKSAGFDALSPMTTAGDIIYGGSSGTATRLAKGSDGQVLTIASGVPAWAAAAAGGSSVTEVNDEVASATAGQTSFTLAKTPAVKSIVKMHINGIRISNTAFTISANVVTYNPANNEAYTLSLGDRIQFDYYY